MHLRILFLFALTITAYAQPVTFYKEKIEMSVDTSCFELTGTYFFKNSGKSQYKHSLYYPFIIDESTSFPDSIFVLNIKNNTPVKYHIKEFGISIPISIAANDTSVYRFFYRQKITAKKAEYILRTTSAWGKPFDHAEYTIKAPSELQAQYIYPKPDTTETLGGINTYKSVLNNFLPGENLILIWR